MPLSFLNPALLTGLLAAAVPLIIHFLSRRRPRRVAFSDLRFLREEEAQQAQRRGLLRWLLLLLRMLIIACLALAAARPHWGGLPGGGGRAVLFVVDASASMQAQDDDGRARFAASVAAAGEMIEELPGGSSVQVVLAGPIPQPLFAAWLPAGPAARSGLTAAAAGDGACDLAGALREAARQVRRSPSRPVEVVILSDLQRVPHTELEAAAAELADVGARVLVRRIGDGNVPGGGVVALELPGRALRPGEAVDLPAMVRPERADQPFWLELDGRRVAEILAPAAAEPGAAVQVTFPFTVPAVGLHTGRVGKDPDRLPADDVLPFVLPVPPQVEVLLAHGADRDGLGRGGWRYLARALDPAADGQGMFRVRAVPADSLREGDLAGVDVLVLVDVGAPGRRLGAALHTWLGGGGGMLVAVGDPTQQDDLREGILPLLGLPRDVTWIARAPDQGERGRLVAGDHAAVGLDAEGAETLAGASWYRYFAVSEGEARVLMQSETEAPLLLQGDVGLGRWALLTGHLRPDATDVMFNPVFLPLMQRLTAYLAAGVGAMEAQVVGAEPTLRLEAGRLARQAGDAANQLSVLVPPEGVVHTARLTWPHGAPRLTAPRSHRAGLYIFTLAGDTLGAVAVTVPVEEAEPRTMAPDQLADRLRRAGIDRVLAVGEADASQLGRALTGRDLSGWLLALALVLLAVEIWLGRRVRA